MILPNVNVELTLLTVIIAVSVTAVWFSSGTVVTFKAYVPAAKPETGIIKPETPTSLPLIIAVIPVAPPVFTLTFLLSQ